MAIFTNSKPSGDDNKKSGTTPEHHNSSNQNSKESNNNMSDMTNSIPFSIPVGMGNCWDHSKNSFGDNGLLYLIFLALFMNNGWGGFGRNGMGFQGGMTPAGAEIAGSIGANIDAARSKIAEVAGMVEAGKCDLSGIENTLGTLGLRVDSVKDTVLGSLNVLTRAVENGNANLASQICECCCSTKQVIADSTYKISDRICDVEKGILKSTAETSAGLSNIGFLVEKNSGQLQNSLTQGFSNVAFGQANITNSISNAAASLGYQSERNTNQIVQAIQSEACQSRQLMAQYHNEDIVSQQRNQIEALKAQLFNLSQTAQTNEIINTLKTSSGTTA